MHLVVLPRCVSVILNRLCLSADQSLFSLFHTICYVSSVTLVCQLTCQKAFMSYWIGSALAQGTAMYKLLMKDEGDFHEILTFISDPALTWIFVFSIVM